MIFFVYSICLAWSIYTATRKVKPEFITLISLVSFMGYYVIGGYLFSDEYFTFVQKKNYAINTFFPTIILAITLASIFGNLLIIISKFKFKDYKYANDKSLALILITLPYIIVIYFFIFQSGFQVFSQNSLSEASILRTKLVYESNIYSIASYASFYVIPFISLILLQQRKIVLPLFLLFSSTLAMTLTGQKLYLGLNLAIIFFYYLYNSELKSASKKLLFIFALFISVLILVVWILNKDSLTFDFLTNLILVVRGISERIMLVGTVVATEYMYLADLLNNDLSLKPQSQPVSQFVYEAINGERENIIGSKPAHISIVQYLKNGMLISLFVTFFTYLSLYCLKFFSDIIFFDKRFAKAVNIYILVAVINLTITDSIQYLLSWLFSIFYIFGATIVLNTFFLILKKNKLCAYFPFKVELLNYIAIFCFIYYAQGIIRGIL